MNLRNFNINLSTFFSLKDKKISVEKAYTEGIYSDTPANRKLGRVGMSYSDWDSKYNNEEGEEAEKIDSISTYRLGRVLNGSDIYPMSVKDHKEYFLVSLEESDFKDKEKVNKTKDVLEKLGAKVYISQNTHFLKAYKKDNIVKEEEEDLFKVGSFKFDVNSRILIKENGEKLELTPKETELLKVFASNPNQFVSRDSLLEKIWGESNYYNSRSMDVYIRKLRDKLSGDKDINLMTVHWKGFKLVLPKSKSKTVIDEQEQINDIVSQTNLLKSSIGKKLDLIIKYSNSLKSKGTEGIKVQKEATDKAKREAIVSFYINTSGVEGENKEIAKNLDKIVKEALATSSIPKKEKSEKEKSEKSEKSEKEKTKKEDSTSTKEKGFKKNQLIGLKEINNYFGFEDESANWFEDTPVSLIMSNDKEFNDIINKFTGYNIVDKKGEYKNNGNRDSMLKCHVEYEIVPKSSKNVEEKFKNKKTFIIDSKTTIRDILDKLGLKS